jgi:hypothetical protein
MWPTPNSTDGSKAPKCFAGGNPSLPTAAKMFPTPQSGANNLAAHGAMSGNFKTKLCESLGIPITGQLNPMWVEWLMGFPIGWSDLDV